MKQALRNLLLVTLLAAAGCEKSSNVSAMQDETASLANQFRSRFEELHKRFMQIEKARKPDIDSNKDIKSLWTMTSKRLLELRNAAVQAQNSIAAAMKSPNPSNDLIRLQSDLRERMSRGETEVVANLHSVESWLSMLAYKPKVVAMTDNPAGTAKAGDPPPVDEPHDLPKTGIHDEKEPPHPAKDAGKMPDGKSDGTAPKTDAKKDAAKTDAPKTDVKKDAPKTDAPKTDAPKTDAKKDAPKTDVKKDAPKTDAKKDAPKSDVKKDAPKKDAPKTGSGSGR